MCIPCGRCSILQKELEDLKHSISFLPKYKDGHHIIHEGPAYTPDGRSGYVEPFSSTPCLIIKNPINPLLDEVWEAKDCYYENPRKKEK